MILIEPESTWHRMHDGIHQRLRVMVVELNHVLVEIQGKGTREWVPKALFIPNGSATTVVYPQVST